MDTVRNEINEALACMTERYIHSPALYSVTDLTRCTLVRRAAVVTLATVYPCAILTVQLFTTLANVNPTIPITIVTDVFHALIACDGDHTIIRFLPTPFSPLYYLVFISSLTDLFAPRL